MALVLRHDTQYVPNRRRKPCFLEMLKSVLDDDENLITTTAETRTLLSGEPSVNCLDLWLAMDNRFLTPKFSFKRF